MEDVQDPVYKPFVSRKRPGSASFYSDVNIIYKNGGMLTQCSLGWSLLFEGDPGWFLYKKNNDLRFSFQAKKNGRADLEAIIQKEFRQIKIHCGTRYIIKNGSSARLSNPLRYPLDQLLLMHILAREGGLIIHAAGIACNGKAYVFAGVSGAGKSTMAGLLGQNSKITPINDDRLVIRKRGTEFLVYGTPWPGEKRISRDMCLPLGGLYFIGKSEKNSIRSISPSECLKRLFQVTSIPLYHKDLTSGVMDFCEGLIREVRMREFSVCPDSAVADYFLEHEVFCRSRKK